MSITINGATNTLTAASGLAIAGNTAVTGTLSATGIITATLGTSSGSDYRLTGAVSGMYNSAATDAVVYVYSDGSAGTGAAFYGSTHATKANTIELKAATAVRATLSSTALTLGTGVNLVMAAGQGIDFSATANGTGTSNVNEVLDDYEAGDFSPRIEFGGATTGITYNNFHGAYRKVGKVVFCTIDLRLSSKGSATGAFKLTGLPFTVQNASAAGVGGGSFIYATGNAALGTGYPSIIPIFSSATASATSFTAGVPAGLDDTAFTNTSQICAQFWYTTD